MKKSSFKITLSIISLVISFSLVGTIICVNKTLDEYVSSYKQSPLDYQFLELSLVETTKIENTSFSLVKHTRPKQEEINEISYLLDNNRISYNYTNLINSYTSLRVNNEEVRISFLPCLDSRITSYNQIIANGKAFEIIKHHQLKYNQKRNIDYINNQSKIISDQIDLSFDFEIVAINEEMELFQEAIVYYHHSLIEEYLYNVKLDNLSSEMKQYVTLGKRIAIYTYEGDFFDTGSVYLVVQNKDQVEKMYQRINNFNATYFNFTCISRSIESFLTLEDLFNKIISAIEIFLFLSLVISSLLMGLTLNSLIIDEEKELGILKSLGVLKKQSEQIVNYQVILILLTSLIISFLVKYQIYSFLDRRITFMAFLSKEHIIHENLILLLMVIVLSIVFISIGKFFVNRINISDVLKED